MPRMKLNGIDINDPCAALEAARNALFQLVTGGQVAEIETPQLGRVAYTQAKAADLQRFIDSLAADCAAALGLTTTGAGRRKPISIEAWP